ncbi:hypothetical protein ACIRQP_01095 [Streptomyces sp. NPDC102274]|uniref:hypothetical protein n=1 Tax=Streptomyces sp. NPDC102274 TaxID=3366151 RepID=UPI00380434BE
MRKTKRSLLGAAVVAVAVLTALSAGPAQGASDGDKERETSGASAAKDDSLAPDRGSAAEVVSSPSAEAALTEIQRRIANYVDTHGTTYTFGSYVDHTTGKIVLETDAPASLVSTLTDLSDAPADENQAATDVRVRATAVSDTFSRRDDSPPFYGGGGITSGGGLCSSGYAVRNSAGTTFSTTAGHCFANGATVLTESGRFTYGTVSNRRLPTVTGEPMDVELIGGQSYSGRTFTGGVDSNTSIPVVSAGGASVGYNAYCHSGRTTGEQCGHTATSISGQVCTATGCKSPVIVYTGGLIQQGGDSGAPFYAKNSSGSFIRGHSIASSGDGSTGYVQPWTVVAPALGVSIVTG